MSAPEADYRRLVETIGREYFIYRHDAAGVMTYASPSIAEMLGYVPQECKSHYKRFLTGHPANAQVFNLTALSLKGERQAPYEVEVFHKDGTTRWLEVAEYPLRDPAGTVVGVEGIARDITERKRTQEALANMQRLESLGTMAGGIAHDFNNILTAILGNLSLLQSRIKGDGEAAVLFQEAQEACGLARSLSNQLLTFAKGGNPVVKVMDLRPVLTRAAAVSSRGTAARCVFDLGERPLPVSIDGDQVSRVIQNLVINAAQAMPEGGDITLRAAVLDPDENARPPRPAGRTVRLTVEDRGPGIQEAHLPRIFDPYFSTKGVGRGLGLATCYSIMTKHGGMISAESSSGHGTIFTLDFPAANAADLPREPAPASGKVRILVMEDEAPVARILKRMLEHLGYHVDAVGDGQAALEAYRQAQTAGRPYAAIFLDLTVSGGLGGLEAMAGLEKLDPTVKAILTSGYADDLTGFAKIGFLGTLAKPYRLEDVSTILRRVLGSA